MALFFITFPVMATQAPAGCPGCSFTWTDTCRPFEEGNETDYNEDLVTSYSPVLANLTDPSDFSNLSWSEAFRSLNRLMKEKYAFSEWRDTDFDALYTAWAPVVTNAVKSQDRAAYVRAITGYLNDIPDGHVVAIAAEGDYGAKYADIGGGFGFALNSLDDGRVIVSYVAEDSAAERAGIQFGDEVTAWNGTTIHEAIRATPYIWAIMKPSTTEGIRVFQERLLVRAPVGTPVSVTLKNESSTRTVNLVAVDDRYDTLIKTSFYLGRQINDIGVKNRMTDLRPQISNDTVTYKTLPGGYAYVAVYGESYDVYRPFKAAMQDAIEKNAPGMVIDLRWNGGGDDNLASCMAGWFVDQPVFYEYITKYDPGTGKFVKLSEAWTQPRPARYSGPVAVMVSPDTISSGEGLPMVFSRTGKGAIISFYGTNGAFGMNGLQAEMPLGMIVFFPDGASLGGDDTIQVDSNRTLTGGIAPDIRVPRTRDTIARAMAGEDVQLTYAMQWLDNRQCKTAATGRPRRESPAAVATALVALGIIGIITRRK